MAVAQSPERGIGEIYFSKKISIILENVPWAIGIWFLQQFQENFARKQNLFLEIQKEMKTKKAPKNILFVKLP